MLDVGFQEIRELHRIPHKPACLLLLNGEQGLQICSSCGVATSGYVNTVLPRLQLRLSSLFV
jgi:hypothetical protein